MDGMVNYGILQPGIGNALAAGYQQAQDRQNALMQQQQQAEMNKMRLESGRMDLDRLQQERQTMLDFQSQLRSMGKDPDLGKMFDVMVQSGIPEQVRLGLEGKQKLTEQQRFAKIMGYEEGIPTTPAAPSVPAAAPATNALTAPAAVPAAPNTMVTPVAAQFGPEQVAAVTNRIQGLLQLGTPQALQAARVLQDQLEMASRQRNTDQWLAVGNNVFNRQTGQFVKNPYATAPAAVPTVPAAASANDDALIAQAIRDGRLDLSQVTSKNKSVIASTLKSNPAHDFRTSGVEFMGAKAGSRTIGTSEAKMTQAASEATEMMNITRQLIPTINPTDYPLLNQAGNYVARNSGNPAQVGFATALNGLVNTYARAINPTGVPTVSDKQHAREVINSAMSSGQLNEALRVMQLEMDAALASPAKARKALGHTKEAEVPGERKPAQAAPAVSADEKAQALSWAKANRSDPRAAKILQMYGEK